MPLLTRVPPPNASRQVRKISRSLSRLCCKQIEMCVLGTLLTLPPSAFGDSDINNSKLLLQMDTCRIGCCALRWRAVRCGSIVAKQGAEETSEKSNFHAGSRGWGGAARAPRTERPRALHSARRRRTGRANANAPVAPQPSRVPKRAHSRKFQTYAQSAVNIFKSRFNGNVWW